MLASLPVDLSPDGQWVAYTIEDMVSFEPMRDEYRHFTATGVPTAWSELRMEVWVRHTRTGEVKNSGGEQASSWAPVWSPDGQRLAFYSDRGGTAGLWVWEKSSGKTRRISDAIVRPFYEGPLWSVDSRSIISKLLPEGMSLGEAAKLIPTHRPPRIVLKDGTEPSVRVYSSPAQAEAVSAPEGEFWAAIDNIYLGDLAIVDVETGKVKRIARNVKARLVSVSPDGGHVAFLSLTGQRMMNDLRVYSFAEDRLRTAASQIRNPRGIRISWSPDGKLLSYLAAGTRSGVECFILPVDGGEARVLAANDHPSFEGGFRAPIWDASSKTLFFISAGALWKIVVATGETAELAKVPGSTINEIVAPGSTIWSPDNDRSVVVLAQESGRGPGNGFYKIELATGKVTPLLQDDSKRLGGIFTFDVSADGQRFVYGQQDLQRPEDLWMTNARFTAPRQITHVAPIFDEYELGTSRVIEWLDPDGRKLRGSLLLPAGYKEGTRYPLVVHVYEGNGGSKAANQFGLANDHPSLNMHVLATRGYAVFYPDAPLGEGRTLRGAADTVLPGINKVIELGFADPNRLAVMGFSQGSYVTLALLVQTTRFKAAIIGAVTHSDMMSGYLYMDDEGNDSTWNYEQGQGTMGKTPWEDRNRYIENSPVFFFDRVQTPLLMFHGTADPIPLSYPDATFVALRRLGKSVEYAVYAGEGHGISGYSNMVDWWNRQIRWLEKYLNTAQEEQIPAAVSQ